MKMQLINLLLISRQNSYRISQKILINYEDLQQNTMMSR